MHKIGNKIDVDKILIERDEALARMSERNLSEG